MNNMKPSRPTARAIPVPGGEGSACLPRPDFFHAEKSRYGNRLFFDFNLQKTALDCGILSICNRRSIRCRTIFYGEGGTTPGTGRVLTSGRVLPQRLHLLETLRHVAQDRRDPDHPSVGVADR